MILYIGNKLSKRGYTPTTVETLGVLLDKEFEIKLISDKKNKVLRLIDMVYHIIIFRKKTNIILIDTYSTLNFYYALICAFTAKCLNIPYIPILHGGDLPRRVKRNRVFSRFLFSNAVENVTPSLYLESELSKEGFNLRHIPNNIEINHYPFKVRRNLRPRLLYVRALQALYNPTMAIDVLSRLSKEREDVELCMVGPDKDGSLALVKAYAEKLGVSQKLKLTGKLSKEEWVSLSETYDIFINTTNVDNQPVSIMEAMALGFPIVSTNAGGIPFLVSNKHDGLLVDRNRADSMANSIRHLISNPQTAEALSKNARAKAETLSWSHLRPQWIDLLTQFENQKP